MTSVLILLVLVVALILALEPAHRRALRTVQVFRPGAGLGPDAPAMARERAHRAQFGC